MIYWVIYDITKNSNRLKVSEECKNFGLVRIQKSAFIGEMTKNTAEMAAIRFKEFIEKNDCIFLIPTCANCFSDKIILGKFEEEKVKKHDFKIVE